MNVGSAGDRAASAIGLEDLLRRRALSRDISAQWADGIILRSRVGRSAQLGRRQRPLSPTASGARGPQIDFQARLGPRGVPATFGAGRAAQLTDGILIPSDIQSNSAAAPLVAATSVLLELCGRGFFARWGRPHELERRLKQWTLMEIERRRRPKPIGARDRWPRALVKSIDLTGAAFCPSDLASSQGQLLRRARDGQSGSNSGMTLFDSQLIARVD